MKTQLSGCLIPPSTVCNPASPLEDFIDSPSAIYYRRHTLSAYTTLRHRPLLLNTLILFLAPSSNATHSPDLPRSRCRTQAHLLPDAPHLLPVRGRRDRTRRRCRLDRPPAAAGLPQSDEALADRRPIAQLAAHGLKAPGRLVVLYRRLRGDIRRQYSTERHQHLPLPGPSQEDMPLPVRHFPALCQPVPSLLSLMQKPPINLTNGPGVQALLP